ncbi:putative conjugative transfer protein TraA [Orientia tsutsugamushi str. Gilliam]|uniref:Putative conjugative transfer protein TraA n=1 Tax=Orientia tsutsugamushi str. Gilliam TaxID=1359184 RepID=A0A0F3M4G2_ORITS|nr:putative conjugative transfer protein TraA [Orientia tsutsugamushi str. Gilliam]
MLIPDYVNQDFKNIQTLMNEVERTAKKRQQPVVEGYSNSIARREGAKFRA